MAKSSSKKKIVIVVAVVLAAALVYLLVCSAVTFVPMVKMSVVNRTACGQSGTPAETIELAEGATLYAFPVAAGQDKYVMVCPGGGYTDCALDSEGFAIAARLNALGYTAFVLQYRVGKRITTYRAPLDDLAAAIGYVDAHAAQYRVQAGLYDLCGFSAGGNLVGLFGTEDCGYRQYAGISKPDAIFMGYPWVNPHMPAFNGNLADYIFYANLTTQGANAFLGGTDHLKEMQVQRHVTPDYPKVYVMHGDSDSIVPIDTSSDLLVAVLEANGIAYRYKRCKGVDHGCGLGLGTAAEGWLDEAVAFAAGN